MLIETEHRCRKECNVFLLQSFLILAVICIKKQTDLDSFEDDQKSLRPVADSSTCCAVLSRLCDGFAHIHISAITVCGKLISKLFGCEMDLPLHMIIISPK